MRTISDRQKRFQRTGPLAKVRWLLGLSVMVAATCVAAPQNLAYSSPRFELSFAATAHEKPVTGRLFLIISRTAEPEVRFQVNGMSSPPIFARDVSLMKAGQIAVIDEYTLGYPLRSLRQLPPGDYYAQAILNVYTEFHRADGHVIWAHMDQWEGQQFNRSPGNLYSKVQKLRIDKSRLRSIKLSLTEVISPVEVPADTEWMVHIKIQSELLSKFWGHPMYLGAVLLLPRGYSSHLETEYPVIYEQGHFGLDGPFWFKTEEYHETEDDRRVRINNGWQTPYEFYKAWSSDHFPRMIAVTFQHPTPYYDDSGAVNSANTGPYGDAIMTELIPYIEQHFRIIRQPYARILEGGSAGGWEALALQLYHPEFFGGAWIYSPYGVDFRRYNTFNIYEDDSAFVFQPRTNDFMAKLLDQKWLPPERYATRNAEGQPIGTMRQLSQFDAVMGSKGRGGGDWEEVWGPVAPDGYPKPLWNKTTGKVDHAVANYWRDQGYDLRYYAEKNWKEIGPQLAGKLHFYCGDMDEFYVNQGVYLFEEFLKKSKDPYYGGSFEYGRPMKGHGWLPMTFAELAQLMADQVAKQAPGGASMNWRNDDSTVDVSQIPKTH